jgi:hypothetical protein
MDYNDWSESLYSYFFHPSSAHEQIFFSIDGALLVELSDFANESDAKSSLGQAVCTAIDGATWNCKKIVNRIDVWERKGSEGAHPALPFLALTVLAVAEMAKAGEGHGANNYYKPLRKLIDPSDKRSGSPGSNISGFSTHIENIWGSIERWSTDELGGETGILSSIAGNLRYVGLALQHNLIRRSDLRRLPLFFRHAGITPDDEAKEFINPPELRRSLYHWSQPRSEQWSTRLATMSEEKSSAEKELQEHCERILLRELRQWDGRPRDPAGRVAGQLRLGIDNLQQPKPSIFAEWSEGLPEEETLTLPNGKIEEIVKSSSIDWYSDKPLPLDDPCIENSLKKGLEVSGKVYNFIFEDNDLYLLRFSAELGKWCSVSNFSYGHPHLFLTTKIHKESIIDFLKGSTAKNSQLSCMSLDGDIFSDWVISRPFRLDVQPDSSAPLPLKPYLHTGKSFRLRLLGGLRIGPTNRVYLKGGEPTIGLSDLAEPSDLVIVKNADTEKSISISPKGNCEEIDLWDKKLETGPYLVTHGPSRTTFQITEGIKNSISNTTVIKGLESTMGRVTGTVMVKALENDIKQTPTPYIVEFSKQDSIFLGSSHNEFYKGLEYPRWWEHKVGGLNWALIDVWLNFEPVWQLIEDGNGGLTAKLVDGMTPVVRRPLASENPKWRTAISQSSLDVSETQEIVALWDTYKKAAQQ